MALSVQGPRRLVIGRIEVFMWSVDLGDHIPQLAAWSPFNGRVMIAWAINDFSFSDYVELGPAYSPQQDLRDADVAVNRWARDHDRSQT